MTDAYIAVTEGSGKQLQTYENSVSGQNVHSEAVTPTNSAGAAFATGAGAVGATVPRTTLASDDPAVTALQVIDDWDESDRAKVNIIVGQAGITAGAGAVAANTPRVTHASDDPVTTALQIMDDWDESDRAKVNPIVGQAGVQGGAGAVSATTQRVVIATDQTAIPVTANPTQPTTGTLANVTMTGSSVTAIASNASRKGASIYNDSGVTVYVKHGTSASSTSFTVKLINQAYYELPQPVYTGIITANGASGDIRVTEHT